MSASVKRSPAINSLPAHQTVEPRELLARDRLQVVGRLRDGADAILEEHEALGVAEAVRHRLDDVEVDAARPHARDRALLGRACRSAAASGASPRCTRRSAGSRRGSVPSSSSRQGSWPAGFFVRVRCAAVLAAHQVDLLLRNRRRPSRRGTCARCAGSVRVRCAASSIPPSGSTVGYARSSTIPAVLFRLAGRVPAQARSRRRAQRRPGPRRFARLAPGCGAVGARPDAPAPGLR